MHGPLGIDRLGSTIVLHDSVMSGHSWAFSPRLSSKKSLVKVLRFHNSCQSMSLRERVVNFMAWFKRRGFEVTVRTLSGLDQVTLSSRKAT
jgi:hypothetical protein